MATEYTLGASASCSDGPCGEVIRVILDPVARTVTHLVVEPRHRPVDGRLVPVAMIDAGATEIGLRCTLAEFDRLDASEEIEFVEGMDYGGGYGSPDAVQGYGNLGGMGVGAPRSGGRSAAAWATTGRRLARTLSPKAKAKSVPTSKSMPPTVKSGG